MSWAFLDDRADENPKLLAVGAEAAWYYACGLCYCRRHEGVPGFIQEQKALVLYPVRNAKRVIELLVGANLWHRVAGGYEVHDYGKVYGKPNAPTGPEVAAKRAEAGRLGGLAKASKRSGNPRSKPPSTNGSNTHTKPASEPSPNLVHARPVREDPTPDPMHTDPSSTDLTGSPACEAGSVEEDRDSRRKKPATITLTLSEYGQLTLGDPGLTVEFIDAAIADWLTEPSDPKLELFGRQWKTTAFKVVRTAWRDKRRRDEIQAKLAAVSGAQTVPDRMSVNSPEGWV